MSDEDFEERAAILEFCAGMSRAEAEAEARQQPHRLAAPPPLPRQEMQTPGYMAFRDKWHSRTRKHF